MQQPHNSSSADINNTQPGMIVKALISISKHMYASTQ